MKVCKTGNGNAYNFHKDFIQTPNNQCFFLRGDVQMHIQDEAIDMFMDLLRKSPFV